MSVRLCPIEQFGTKPCVMIHLQKPEYRAKSLDCFLLGHGHSEGSSSKMTVCSISSELLTFLQPNLLWLCIIRGYSVVQRVKVRVQILWVCPSYLFWTTRLACLPRSSWTRLPGSHTCVPKSSSCLTLLALQNTQQVQQNAFEQDKTKRSANFGKAAYF